MDEGADCVEVWERGETMGGGEAIQELLWKPDVKRSVRKRLCKCKG
jgi:hypothetical protein